MLLLNDAKKGDDDCGRGLLTLRVAHGARARYKQPEEQ